MLILRGLYKSGIVVDQKHPDGESYTDVYKNDLYRWFVAMLLNDPIEENDILLRVEWIHEDGSIAM